MSKPQLVALLMCDQAFQQVGTHKWCIIGVFDTVHAPELPVMLPQLSVYVALSDFQGDTVVELVIRDQEGEVVKGVRGEIPKAPVGLFQHVFLFPEVAFTKAGVYTLELLSGGELLTLRSFRVQTGGPDPQQESAEADALAEAHVVSLVEEAKKVLAEHSDAEPFGLIVSPGASEQVWFRQAFEQVLGDSPPDMGFAGIVDRGTLVRLLAGQLPNFEQAIQPPVAHAGRLFCVVIVTKNGFKFGFHPIDE